MTGRKKGTPKTGGRSKGTTNKDSATARELAEQLGVSPFKILLHLANGDWKSVGYKSETETRVTKDGSTIEVDRISADLRGRCAADACRYIHPQLKSVEHSGKDGANLFDTLAEAFKASATYERHTSDIPKVST